MLTTNSSSRSEVCCSQPVLGPIACRQPEHAELPKNISLPSKMHVSRTVVVVPVGGERKGGRGDGVYFSFIQCPLPGLKSGKLKVNLNLLFTIVLVQQHAAEGRGRGEHSGDLFE